MIDTKDMDLEESKDLHYDIRDGKVKYEDVLWHWAEGYEGVLTSKIEEVEEYA